ncbi:hypothetical protein BDV93DRAFT_557781 [Ceratobasidium sp. AG-I]|nr:hypothetical protein BDV93DRAFT_557781 [Ceratobasidium sp. AG-I]
MDAHAPDPFFWRSALLDRLAQESLLSVDTATAKFLPIPVAPGVDYIQPSSTSPTLFTAASNFESSYALWLTLPVPTIFHHSALRRALSEASDDDEEPCFSLEVLFGSRRVYLPTWVVDIWASLRALQSCCRAWASAKSWLQTIATTSGPH